MFSTQNNLKSMQDKALESLRAVMDPDLGKDIVTLGFVKELSVDPKGVATCTIELTTPACPVKDQLRDQARQALTSVPGVSEARVQMTAQVRPLSAPARDRLVPQVRNIIPVASGKGGVGKSTLSANLAVALALDGARVGLMDADVYGPSIPAMLGINEKPGSDGHRIFPVERHGIKIISMGFFVPQNDAVIWRGPMLHKMVQDFLGVVDWGELDYLIVDLPPGTGDIQLSLCQSIPVTGAVIVSTPQDVAWQVAQKAIVMFDKLQAPVLGIIENMSRHVCSKCSHEEAIFGEGGARRAAAQLGIPMLGEVPLVTRLRAASDAGVPLVLSDPAHPAAQALRGAARALAAGVSVRNLSADERPRAAKVDAAGLAEISIEWTDGKRTVQRARDLRLACPCAACVDEITGERTLRPESVPDTLTAVSVHPVGRYALQFVWSDGHSTGLYGHTYLRRLAGLS
ncbi:MAG: Iron-sulfur cluster carrier protein [Candidatus Omnitrophica bacterium]|nr:Iron-sulfur cluster carrier protein [Candidatus Omnitrophota bacterium]